jgi:hypothetical protein
MACILPSARPCSRICLVACLFTIVAVEGCGPKTPTAKQRLDRELQENPEFRTSQPVAKFAGRVTVDGRTPRKDCKLFVILNEPEHLGDAANAEAPKFYATCDANGNFAFTTNEPRDGVIPGKYIVTFVELHPLQFDFPAGHLRKPIRLGYRQRYVQPDELRNLYSDPEKNGRSENFNLDVELPGRDDYHFDLTVAGQEPIGLPGPNAFNSIPVR